MITDSWVGDGDPSAAAYDDRWGRGPSRRCRQSLLVTLVVKTLLRLGREA